MDCNTNFVNTLGMIVTHHFKHTQWNLDMRVSLEQVNSEKGLGVIFDDIILFMVPKSHQYRSRAYTKIENG